MNTQAFWTSKTFWTIIIGLIVFIANNYFQVGIPNELVISVMGLLALIFRWVADQPLSVTSKK